jgi:hypothetical protein
MESAWDIWVLSLIYQSPTILDNVLHHQSNLGEVRYPGLLDDGETLFSL